MTDYRLSLAITHADGSETRWGPDELDAHDVPTGLKFSTVNPGGFETLSCDLLRRIDTDQPDQNLFDTVTVYGPGNEVVWEGRFQQFPRQTADGYTVSPGGEGWAAHLRDNKAFREIYVDRDLSKWGDASLTRRNTIVATGYGPTSASVANDETSGSPALVTAVTGTWDATAKANCEPIYSSASIPIGSVYYAWTRGANVSAVDTNWDWRVNIATTDTYSGLETTSNLRATGPSTGTLSASNALKTFAGLQLQYATSGGVANVEYAIFWTCLAVYGNHGLTKRGTASATLPQGFYASDIIPHAITNGAPLLNYTTGADGSIQNTSIVFDQLAFLEPTTTEEVVKRCNAVHLWDWFVWENRTFYFQEPGTGSSVTWTVRLDDGAHLSDDGPAAQDVINGVIVAYHDAAGQRRYAGPVGSGCTVEDANLQDSSVDNAATAHGITKKWDVLELSEPASDTFAVSVGTVYLTERSTVQHRGQAVITGQARHPTRGLRPSWAIRSGDYVQFTDVNDDSIGEPRRIIRTEYDHEQRANTLTLDSTPYTLDALLEILGAALLNT